MTTPYVWFFSSLFAVCFVLLFWALYSLKVTQDEAYALRAKTLAEGAAVLSLVRIKALCAQANGSCVSVDDVLAALEGTGPTLTPPDWPFELKIPPRHRSGE